MKKSKFSEAQIFALLNQGKGGVPVPELCREHWLSSATYYAWRRKYGGMEPSMMAEMKALQAENNRP